MTSFEYLSVLLSIILGLAVTQVLQGYRSLLLARSDVRAHAPTLIWSGLVLLIALQSWWASFGLDGVRDWRFEAFLAIVVQMGLIYLMAALILPDVPSGAEIDLGEHFKAQRKPFFACLIALVVTSLAKDVIMTGELPGAFNVGVHGALAAIGIAALLLRGNRAQLIIAIVTVLILAAYIATLFARLDV